MRPVLWLLLALIPLALASSGVYLWVRYDLETGKASLSDGTPLPGLGGLTPGQYVKQKWGGIKPKRQWRPPNDIEVTYPPTQGMTRVVFSHERHFAALGVKECTLCHESLDENKTWPSRARGGLEPHGQTSLGRFCSTCHDGRTRTRSIKGTNPPVDTPIFTAFGGKNSPSCAQCHVPKGHGADFTQTHGDWVEDRGARECNECHRGSLSITQRELAQGQSFIQAQLALLRNPEDEQAFQVALPHNFCAYCHIPDGKAWREGRKGED